MLGEDLHSLLNKCRSITFELKINITSSICFKSDFKQGFFGKQTLSNKTYVFLSQKVGMFLQYCCGVVEH